MICPVLPGPVKIWRSYFSIRISAEAHKALVCPSRRDGERLLLRPGCVEVPGLCPSPHLPARPREARLPALQLAAGLVEKLFLNATLGTGMALLEADDKHSKLSLMAPGNDAERYPPASSQSSN